jgi:hypothetical protein
LGAVVAVSVPGLATGSLNRRVTLGAVYGVFAALVGVVVFYVLLSGLRGA